MFQTVLLLTLSTRRKVKLNYYVTYVRREHCQNKTEESSRHQLSTLHH